MEPLYYVELSSESVSMKVTNQAHPYYPRINFFNALEREQAIEFGKNLETMYGCRKNIKEQSKLCNIDVLIPEMVKIDSERNRISKEIQDLKKLLKEAETEVGMLKRKIAMLENAI